MHPPTLVVSIFIAVQDLYLYNMLRYVVYLVFIVSAAMAAGGIILSSRLRNRYHHEAFSALLYFQVFIFTFGFYGIWGQVLIKAYLSAYISAEVMARITEVSMLLGLPFLVFAWLMLIRMACGLAGRICRNWFVLAFLTGNFALIVTIGYLMSDSGGIKPVLLLKTYYMSMNLINSIAVAWILLSAGRESILTQREHGTLAISMILIMILQIVSVFFYVNQPLIGFIFVIAFFTGNAYAPVFLSYMSEPRLKQPVIKATVQNISFEEFCRKFEVSPREKDIIWEICNGLSNKEISEKLFISLQTVKDHTHRIYIKTNVRSRAQLMNLVKSAGEEQIRSG